MTGSQDRFEDAGNNINNEGEPRQFLRLQRKKTPNGLVKVELLYVSYQTIDNVPNDMEIAAAALGALNQALCQSLCNMKNMNQDVCQKLA